MSMLYAIMNLLCIILWVCVGADRYHQKDTLLLVPFELCDDSLTSAIFHPFGILDARDGISSKMIFGLKAEVRISL